MVIIRATAIPVKRAVTHIRATPGGGRVVSLRGEGSTSIIEVWDGGSGDMIATFRDEEGRVEEVSIMRDGQRVVSRAAPGKDWMWDVETGGRTELEGRDRQATAEDAWTAADGLLTVTKDDDGQFRALERDGSRCLFSRTLQNPPQRILGVTPGARHLIGRDGQGPIEAWDLHRGGTKLPLPKSLDVQSGPVLSPCGRYLVARSDEVLTGWVVGSWSIRFQSLLGPGERKAVTRTAFTEDSGFVITTTKEGWISVRNSSCGECQMRYFAGSQISAMTTRGSLVAVGTDVGALHLLKLSEVSIGVPLVPALPVQGGGFQCRCSACGEVANLEGRNEEVVECSQCGEVQRMVPVDWALNDPEGVSVPRS
jgi:WD40 repeat protein